MSKNLFYWQNGCAAFSVSPLGVDDVTEYITNQKAHHYTVGYQEEVRAFLRKFKVEYDEAYFWD